MQFISAILYNITPAEKDTPSGGSSGLCARVADPAPKRSSSADARLTDAACGRATEAAKGGWGSRLAMHSRRVYAQTGPVRALPTHGTAHL